MFQFLGYDFLGDVDCLNPAPSQIENITITQIQNGIFDHYNVTKNTDTEYTTNKPDQWDFDTIMDADFNGTLDAGNVDFLIEEVSAIKIKRRVINTFQWITLETIDITDLDSFNFITEDHLNANDTQYEYAFVPVINGVEGEYIIGTVYSKFNGIFIADAKQIFKFFYDAEFGTDTQNIQVGTFEPLGSKYPRIIANGLLNYASGSFTATVINDDFDTTGQIDRAATTQKKKDILAFLVNHGAKILKDYNANFYLVAITNSPQITYKDGSSGGVPQITFEWTEIGDGNNQQDLYYNGLISEVD